MKKLLTIIFLLSAICSHATTYYFSGDGDNGNSGLTTALPKATLSAASALTTGGNTILFERGYTYTGTLVINSNGCTIDVWGTGEKPIISGFTILSSWTNEGGGIYSKIITSDAQTNMVIIDGIQYGMGRYPDNTYLNFESVTSNTAITDNTLGTSTIWTNAEAFIKKEDWKGDRCLITDHTSNTLTYTSYGSSTTPKVNYGYFIQNDLRTLTTYGEWYHNAGTGKFSMYFGGVDPNSKVVKVAAANYGINVGGYDNLSVSNIQIEGTIQSGIYQAGGNNNNTITYCNIYYCGKSGIDNGGSGTGNTFTYNTISQVNGYGIYDYSASTIINYNSIRNVGSVIGQYKSSDGYSGIYAAGYNVNIKYNDIRNCGYDGIIFRSLGTGLIADVSYNFIDSTCTLFDDGAGIYTSTSDAQTKIISYNTVLNVIGNSDGTNNSTSYSPGIYLDETETNTSVIGNTVAHTAFAGIKLHKANNNIIRDNIVYDNLYSFVIEDYVGNQVRNNDVKNNIFFAKTTTQYAFWCYTGNNDIPDFFGTADSNYYVKPIDDDYVFYLRSPAFNYVYKTLAEWKTIISDDTHSNSAPKTITNVSELDFQYNWTGSPVTYTHYGYSKVEANGTITYGSTVIPAYSSKVLMDNGTCSCPAPGGGGNIIRWRKFRN